MEGLAMQHTSNLTGASSLLLKVRTYLGNLGLKYSERWHAYLTETDPLKSAGMWSCSCLQCLQCLHLFVPSNIK